MTQNASTGTSTNDESDSSSTARTGRTSDRVRTRSRSRGRARRDDDGSSDSGHVDGAAPRARSRARSGAADPSASGGATTRAKRDASGQPSEAAETGGDGDDGSGDSPRRRRGRRGRRGGRGGRSGGRSGGKPITNESADQDTGRSTAKRRSDGRGRPGKGSGSSGSNGSTRPSGSRTKSSKQRQDGDEPERAISRGGTRMAAKRSGRGGSGRRSRPGGVPEEVRRAILDGPPRSMLVTAREDRTQIAILEDRTVVEHFVTRAEDVTYVGNIYMARVQNVLPGMEAAFLDIGKGRNGVLYAGEVLYDELDLEEGGEQRIENVLESGQKVLVQVTKDPMGTKGPRLTMHLSLAGRYMVLAPGSELFGISRKLTDKERDRLRTIVKRVKPDEHGVIVRTAAENATEEQLTADLERLLAKWARVEERAADAKALTAVYEEPALVVKVIRDNFGPEFERCVVDAPDLHAEVRDYLGEVAPELLDKVELYAPADPEPEAPGKSGKKKATDPSPSLFDDYHVSEQLRRAMGRKVWLPSGGYLIIEATEAMKVIDVNTGKFTGGSDTSLEEIVLKTNLEAADEIVRQLRLRDLGGMIVIDFIDMLLPANQAQVVRRLERELLRDRTKTRVSEVSRLGLVQMTRKNVSQGLVESFSHTCETCDGHGFVSELD